MASFLKRLFNRRPSSENDDSGESFALRFHRFRLFLSAYIDAYSEMMNFEERLGDSMPFGMPFLRRCTTRLTIASMQCIMQLNSLGGNRFAKLDHPFSALRSEVQDILAKGATPLSGPLVVPFNAIGEEHEAIVSSSLVKLRAVRESFPEYMPKGFVVTGAAWWQYFNNPELHDEIDRIMLISLDDPASYSEAGATIRERMSTSFPLPEALIAAVRDMLEGHYPELEIPGHVLLVRGLPVLTEHGALIMPELVLYTPVSVDDVLKAIRSSLSMAYRPRAIIYRLKRGIRDRAMPFCISLTLIPEVHGRGSAHRKFDPNNPDELFVHVHRGFTAPGDLPSLASVVGATLPEKAHARVEESVRNALDCLADAPVRGNRHEITWAASEHGRLYVLGVNVVPDPVEPETIPEQERRACAGRERECLQGGFCTYPGTSRGKAYLVRNFVDALGFSIGDILVLRRASPRWAFLLDFASGAIVGDGTGNGMFARAARRYGRPTVLRQPEAFDVLTSGQPISLFATVRGEPFICPDVSQEREGASDASPENFGNPGAAYPTAYQSNAPLSWLPSSDLAMMAQELAPRVVSLTLPDSDDINFLAKNCKTFHDILTYCHVHAVREMYRAGTSSRTAQAPAKQLVCEVPKQFWIINLNDGFSTEIKGPVVRLEEITSVPMLSLWEGFNDKPWDGPPQINAKGFLSVLFEATANPNLDPASQSTQYTEKNVFLIAKRFCSMRCRFGFHFLSMDCLLGERERERFIIFQFKGGAANLTRRIRRVHFVAELLSQFDFATEIVGDTLTARLEQKSEAEFLSALRVLGYITMHTRQLDMIMGDEAALTVRRLQMLEDMLALAERPSTISF